MFTFFAMCFCHVFDDYVLQGCLANMKQKTFWQNDPIGKQNKYKYDYVAALVCHAFSWTFMIMLPLAIAHGGNMGWMFWAYPVNTAIHAFVDNLKANKFRINLIEDQLIHFAQIVITFVLTQYI